MRLLGRYLLTAMVVVLGPVNLLSQELPHHHSHPTESATVPTSSAVISIHYNCIAESSREAGICTKTVAKQDFDALVHAINPNMSADGRQALAAEYARLLIMAAEARRRGIDQLPELRTLVEYSTLQLLGARLVKDINSNASPVTSDQMEGYFREHARDYQKVAVSRIFVPMQSNGGHHDTPPARRVDQLRQRALSGEDFHTLQSEVKEASHIVRLGPMPCRSLPEEHRRVCDLKLNEVSQVFVDKTGYSFYRLESRKQRELNDVREEVRGALERQHLQDQIHAVRTPISLDLDESYFGKLPKPDVASHHGMHFPKASAGVSSSSPDHNH